MNRERAFWIGIAFIGAFLAFVWGGLVHSSLWIAGISIGRTIEYHGG